MRLALAATAMIICVVPIAFSQTQHDAATIQQIQKVCETHDAKYNAKGPADDADSYAEDAVVVLPSGTILRGREAIIKSSISRWKEGAKRTCKVDDGQVIGDTAWAVGDTRVIGLEKPYHVRWAAFDVKNGNRWEIKMLSATSIEE